MKLRLIATLVFDLLVVCAVLSVRWQAQPHGLPDLSMSAVSDLPRWWWNYGSLYDWLLAGPDAGNWAANAQNWIDGDVLDSHRLPTYTVISAWFGGWFGDVVFGGHMANHIISALTCVVAYSIGTSTTNRVVGLGAALLTAWSPELVNNQLLYGVDPSLQLFVAALCLSTWLAVSKESLRWTILAGIFMGLLSATHYLGLLFVPIPLLMLFVCRGATPNYSDPGWKLRAARSVLLLGVGFIVWKLVTSPWPDLSLTMVASVFTQGVAGSDGRVVGPAQMEQATAAQLVMSNLATAPGLAVQRGLRSLSVGVLPWWGLVGLFWFGVASPFTQKEGVKGWNWQSGALLLGFLVPLVALEASRAPDRYALFSRPIIFVIVLRGLWNTGPAAVRLYCFALDRRVHRRVSQTFSVICVGLMLVSIRTPLTSRWSLTPPTDEGLAERSIAVEISQSMPNALGVVTSSQSIPFYAGIDACPQSQCMPGGPQQNAQCIERMLSECGGSGSIPYLVIESLNVGLGNQPLTELNTLLASEFEPVHVSRARNYTVSLYGLDRAKLRVIQQRLSSQR